MLRLLQQKVPVNHYEAWMSLPAKERNEYLREAIAQKLAEKNLISAWLKIFNYLEAIKVACSIEEFDNEPKLHEAVKNKAAELDISMNAVGAGCC